MADVRVLRTGITNAVRAVERLRRLIEANGGYGKVTLTFAQGEWSGGFEFNATGQLSKETSREGSSST
jgi:hypothetical protein